MGCMQARVVSTVACCPITQSSQRPKRLHVMYFLVRRSRQDKTCNVTLYRFRNCFFQRWFLRLFNEHDLLIFDRLYDTNLVPRLPLCLPCVCPAVWPHLQRASASDDTFVPPQGRAARKPRAFHALSFQKAMRIVSRILVTPQQCGEVGKAWDIF